MQKGSFISPQLRSGEALLQNRRTDFPGRMRPDRQALSEAQD